MARWRIGLFALCVATGTLPTAIAAPPAQTEQAAAYRKIEQFFQHLQARDYKRALSIAEDFGRSSADPGTEAMRDALRASALLGLDRDAEAQQLYAKAH